MKSASVLSLVIVAALGMAAAANAQNGNSPPPHPDQAQVIPKTSVVHRAALPSEKQHKQREQAKNSDCLRETGSLIKARKGHCLPVSGHSYSQEDLKNTGQPDTARALQMLDPRITAHGH